MTRREQTIWARLHALRAEVEAGGAEMVGKTYRDASGKVAGRYKSGFPAAYPEVSRAGLYPGQAAAAIKLGKGKRFRRLWKETERVLDRFGDLPRETRRSRGRLTVSPHAGNRRCKHCRESHSSGEHRFHGPGAFYGTHVAAAERAAMRENPLRRNPKIRYRIMADGRRFPVYEGKLLSRVPSSQFTPRDESEGAPRTRLVLQTLTKKELQKEYNEALRGSFDPMFPAGKRYFKLVQAEMDRRGVKSEAEEFFGPLKNPRKTSSRSVVVYGRVLRVDAQKTQPHVCDDECKRFQHRYTHEFKPGVVMYGLPDGSLLLKKE